MPKRTNLNEVVPLRVDEASLANIQAIIDSGLAADRSAALRAAAAITARIFSEDPHVYVVDPDHLIFGSQEAAEGYLESHGAVQVGEEWVVCDGDGDPKTWYSIKKVLPM